MTCHCGRPAPHRLVDDDGAHPLCGLHFQVLVAAAERHGNGLVASVEPVAVVTG